MNSGAIRSSRSSARATGLAWRRQDAIASVQRVWPNGRARSKRLSASMSRSIAAGEMGPGPQTWAERKSDASRKTRSSAVSRVIPARSASAAPFKRSTSCKKISVMAKIGTTIPAARSAIHDVGPISALRRVRDKGPFFRCVATEHQGHERCCHRSG
jgi:hypothetical protein